MMSTPTPSKLSPFVKQCLVTAAVCSNIIGNAATVGYPGVLLPQLQLPGSIITLTQEQASWLTSAMALVALLGTFMSLNIMRKMGRRLAHVVASIPAMIGWMVTFFASNFTMLLIGRVQQSISFGISLGVRSVIIGEYTSSEHRGVFSSAVFLSQAFGIFFVHLIGYLIGWQKTALVCMVFPFAAFVMTFLYPESPKYLAAKGKYDECRDAFHWLRGHNKEDELEELIQTQIDKNRDDELFKQKLRPSTAKGLYKPILLMIHVHAMMSFAGGSALAAYSTQIIGLIIGKDPNTTIWMISLDVQRIISSCLAIYMIYKFRRRIMLFSTGALCILSHLAIAGYVCGKNPGFRYDAWWIGLLLLNVQYFSVAAGMIPLPNVIIGEVFPVQSRKLCSIINVIAGAVTTFLVLKFLPSLLYSIGLPGTYFFHAGVLSYFLFVIWFLQPETKDKTWEEIEDEFRGIPLEPEEAEARRSLRVAKKVTVKPVPTMISFG